MQLRHEWSFTYSFIAFRSLDHVIITVHDITYRCVTPPPPPAQPALLPAYATVAAGLNLFSDKENMLHTTIWQHRYSVYDLRATWLPIVQSQRILALKKQCTKHVVRTYLIYLGTLACLISNRGTSTLINLQKIWSVSCNFYWFYANFYSFCGEIEKLSTTYWPDIEH